MKEGEEEVGGGGLYANSIEVFLLFHLVKPNRPCVGMPPSILRIYDRVRGRGGHRLDFNFQRCKSSAAMGKRNYSNVKRGLIFFLPFY